MMNLVRTALLLTGVVLALRCHPTAHATFSTTLSTTPQDGDSYDAWAAVFDAMSPGWNGADDGDGQLPLVSPEDLLLIRDLGYDFGRAPTDAERAALDRLSVLVPLLEDATATRPFTAPVDEADGWFALLPHLAGIRAASQTMNAFANRDVADGNYGGAMDWVGRMLQSGGQVAQDEYFISSLVGAALAKSSGGSMDWLIGRGVVDQAMAADWLAEYDWIADMHDPFNLAEAMAKERRIMVNELGLIADALDAGVENERLEMLESVMGDAVLDGVSSDEIRAELTTLDGYFDDMESALADPDRGRALETLQAIDDEIAASDPPLLTAGLLPDLVKLMEVVTSLERDMADRLRLLEGLASGRLQPAALRNPAILWLELGTRFEELPADVQIAGLRILNLLPESPRATYRLQDSTVETDPDALLRDALQGDVAETIWLSGLDSIGPSLTTLALDAAAIDPEDFKAGTDGAGPAILNAELERFRAAGLGLLVDAHAHLDLAAHLSIDEPGSMDVEVQRQIAVDEIVSVIALARGLISDASLSHVLIASDLILRLADLLESPQARDLWTDDVHRDRLMTAITSIPRLPALGLAEAREADFDRLVRHLFGRSGDASVAVDAIERLNTLSADAIYHIAAAADSIQIVPADTWFDESLPPETLRERSTPTEIESEEAYRPLRLLASLDEVLGTGLIAVESPEMRDAFTSARTRWRGAPTAGRDALMRLQGQTPPLIGVRGSQALNRVADLDRVARDARDAGR